METCYRMDRPHSFNLPRYCSGECWAPCCCPRSCCDSEYCSNSDPAFHPNLDHAQLQYRYSLPTHWARFGATCRRGRHQVTAQCCPQPAYPSISSCLASHPMICEARCCTRCPKSSSTCPARANGTPVLLQYRMRTQVCFLFTVSTS